MDAELPHELLVTGSPDNQSAIYVSKEDMLRRIYLGWTLEEIVQFELNQRGD